MVFRLQALAKLERGSTQDLADVRAMLDRDLITAESLAAGFDAVKERLFRYPAIDADEFARQVAAFLADLG